MFVWVGVGVKDCVDWFWCCIINYVGVIVNSGWEYDLWDEVVWNDWVVKVIWCWNVIWGCC